MGGTNPTTLQKGSWTHHFHLEGISIWRTPSFSLKYSNFTLAISSIESHQGWLRPRITCELRHDRLHSRTTYRTVYVWATYELRQNFMLRQPVSPAMLELPLSRNLDLDHILELHYSSLHHMKMQVRSIKSNSSFQKKHTTSQIAEKVETYFSLTILNTMQDSFLVNQEITLELILKQHPKVLFLSMAFLSQSESS